MVITCTERKIKRYGFKDAMGLELWLRNFKLHIKKLNEQANKERLIDQILILQSCKLAIFSADFLNYCFNLVKYV